MKSSQTFNGIKFYLEGNNGYYRYSTGSTSILMHRYVWEYYNGVIPPNHDIHHIDGDKSNNDITNLVCINSNVHKKLHGMKLTEAQREWRRHNLAVNARPKAVEWHKSEEGKLFHSRLGKLSATRNYSRRCVQCGSKFTTSQAHSKFCSNKCKSKYRRDNHLDDELRLCEYCGKEFFTNKFKQIRYCSRSCANRARKGN